MAEMYIHGGRGRMRIDISNSFDRGDAHKLNRYADRRIHTAVD